MKRKTIALGVILLFVIIIGSTILTSPQLLLGDLGAVFSKQNPKLLQSCSQSKLTSKIFVAEWIQNFLNTPIPKNMVEEKIVFAVNKNFADINPQWRTGAEEIIVFVNSILKKNTEKQLKIARYMTYDVPVNDPLSLAIQRIKEDPAYRLVNGTKSDDLWGGMTVIFYVGSDTTEKSGGSSGLQNGKNFGTAGIYNTEENTSLRGKAYYQKTFGPSWEDMYREAIKVPLHEIGHALGIASPDWYNFNHRDYTEVLPFVDLNSYNLNMLHPNDPMTTGGGYPYKFSDFNALIINKNIKRPLNNQQIFELLVRDIVVCVKDSSGQPVPGAIVKVYGIKQEFNADVADPNTIVLRETVKTGPDGKIVIKAPLRQLEETPDGSIFNAEIVKVSKNGKYGGSYVNTVMLQKTRVLEKENIYYMDIIIK